MLKVNDNGSFKREREKKKVRKKAQCEREREKKTNKFERWKGGALEIISVETVASGNFKFKSQEGGERK